MKKNHAFTLVSVVVLLVLAFVGAAMVRVGSQGISGASSGNVPSVTPEETAVTPAPTEAVTVYYITVAGTAPGAQVPVGTAVLLEDPEPVEGYTFLGWQDENGALLYREAVTVEKDSFFAAQYAVALTNPEHLPYLTADAAGFVYPDNAATRREAAVALYNAFAVSITGSEGFADVPADDSCYAAVCALRQLGVLDGELFRPDDAITLRALLELAAPFFPTLRDETVTFANLNPGTLEYDLCANAALHGWVASGDNEYLDPDVSLTRGEFAVLMNQILGRTPAGAEATLSAVLTDVSPDHPAYYALLEAVLPHSYTSGSGTEVWTNFEPVSAAGPGMVLQGYTLYYINNDGSLLRGGEVNGFAFDADGRYTCGNAALDALVAGELATLYTDGMTREELLRAAYLHVVNDFGYRKGDILAVGAEIPADDYALSFFTDRKGNCYGFSCGFRALARALGYDCNAYSGLASNKPHSWTDINIDGCLYVCDPELEFQYKDKDYQDLYMKTYSQAWKWYYTKHY